MATQGRRRRTYWPKFSAYLLALREGYQNGKWGTKSIDKRARELGLKGFSRNRLERAERGWAKTIEPDFLRGVAVFYSVPYEEVTTHYLREAFGVDAVIPGTDAATEKSLDDELGPGVKSPTPTEELDAHGDGGVPVAQDPEAIYRQMLGTALVRLRKLPSEVQERFVEDVDRYSMELLDSPTRQGSLGKRQA